MKPVVVLQHIACETLGTFESRLALQKIPFRYIQSYLGGSLPTTPEDFSALIVMGGPMGVYEENKYPFLTDEKRLMERAIRAGRPVLGVCLGSQLLASVLGANVRKGTQKEIGWYPVRFSGGSKKTVTAFHWHGDIFDLPKGATALASSDLTAVQAYRYSDNTYGYLFHMEVTEPMIREWVRSFAEELSSASIDPKRILEDIPDHLPALNALGDETFDGWMRQIARI